jgi:hypothetical protein
MLYSVCVFDVHPDNFWHEQENCRRLEEFFSKAKNGTSTEMEYGATTRYELVDGLLYQRFSNPSDLLYSQLLMVPYELSHTVVRVANATVMGGLCGSRATIVAYILQHMLWPSLSQDFRVSDEEILNPAKLQNAAELQLVAQDKVFHKVGLTILGPTEQATAGGNKFIMMLVDEAIGLPEAVALASMQSSDIAQGLASIFTRLHFPTCITLQRNSPYEGAVKVS